MVQIDMEYQGRLRCRAVHEPSGTVLLTDAPKDNQGNGESFSPTDLVATALASCMLTIMGLAAKRLGADLAGATARVTKEMVANPVRRIGKLTVEIHGPAEVSAEHRVQLERAALACPVHHSLHPDVQMPIVFHWGDSV
jgi:putative redox protein